MPSSASSAPHVGSVQAGGQRAWQHVPYVTWTRRSIIWPSLHIVSWKLASYLSANSSAHISSGKGFPAAPPTPSSRLWRRPMHGGQKLLSSLFAFLASTCHCPVPTFLPGIPVFHSRLLTCTIHSFQPYTYTHLDLIFTAQCKL